MYLNIHQAFALQQFYQSIRQLFYQEQDHDYFSVNMQ